MVGPELDHALEQLPVRVHGAADGRLGDVARDDLRVRLHVELVRREKDRRIQIQPRLAVGIAHRLGVQLPLEIAVVAERVDPADILGRHAHRGATEQPKFAARRSLRLASGGRAHLRLGTSRGTERSEREQRPPRDRPWPSARLLHQPFWILSNCSCGRRHGTLSFTNHSVRGRTGFPFQTPDRRCR